MEPERAECELESARDTTPGSLAGFRGLGWSKLCGALAPGLALALAISVMVTGALWRLESRSQAQQSHERLSPTADQLAIALRERLGAYQNLLEYGALELGGANPVNRGDWQAFLVHAMRSDKLRGAQLIGYASMLNADQRSAAVAAMRADGFPDFDIAPAGERERYASIVYLHPMAGENLRALGFDAWSDPVQRAAMEAVLDTGQPALSEPSGHPMGAIGSARSAVSLYVPVYRADTQPSTAQERRQALAGFMVCVLRAEDLVPGLQPNLETDAVVELFDGKPSPQSLLFSTRGNHAPRLALERDLDLAGRHWTLRMGSSPAFEARYLGTRPSVVFYGGLGLALGLFGLMLLGASYQRRMLAAHRGATDNHDRYAALVNSIPGTVFRADATPPWTFEYLSEGVRELSGKAPSYWIGNQRFFRELVHPDDLERVVKVMTWATSRGQPFEIEYRIVEAGHWVRWVKQRTRVTMSPKGKPLWLTGVMTDVTHTHDLMESLVKQRETLEQQVALRTADLRQAKEAAESANVAKGAFLRAVSHELRTPLNAVMGFSTLLLDTEPAERRRKQLREILNASRRLLKMINRVIDFSRIEAGALTLEQAAFQPEELLATLVESLRERLLGKPVELVLDIAPELKNTLIGDPQRIGEILFSLVDNAIKFTEQGEVVVELKQERRSDNSVLLGVTVRDTGIGIEPEQRALLFQTFKQLDDATTRRYEGMGLGLAVAQRLVELMGGTIGVDSTPGAGSCFWFNLPLETGSMQTQEALWSEPALQGARVLVAEENSSLARMLSYQMEQLGCSVLRATNTAEALQLLSTAAAEERAVPIMLLDASLPGASARELTHLIRALALPVQPRIALLVSDPGTQIPDVGAVLLKPVLPGRLRDAVRELASRPDHNAEAVEAAADLATRSTNDAELREACNEIRHMLSQGEFKVASVIQAHAPMLQANLPDMYPQLESAVRAFDFNTAITVLEEGCRSAGLRLSGAPVACLSQGVTAEENPSCPDSRLHAGRHTAGGPV
jgi:signal transduction histidine kinase/CHASE1-domain containing sensor protein/CheY-like chemotaxis protein